MQGNVLGQSGGSSKIKGLNVYVQLEEPKKKDGIWIKTEECAPVSMIYKQLKSGSYDYFASITIGSDIYLIDYFSSTYTLYKYDILTNEISNLKDIPYAPSKNQIAVVGTDIYFVACGDDNDRMLKYDTLTNTFSTLTNTPHQFYTSEVTAVGTDIYIFGNNYDGNTSLIIKYDTLTNTYTTLPGTSMYLRHGSAVAIGTDVYLIGCGTTYDRMYKYDTLTNEISKLKDIPSRLQYGAVSVVDTNIYLIGCGSSSSDANIVYKYDILTDTYTKLTNTPYNSTDSASAIGADIYLFSKSGLYKFRPDFKLPSISKYKYEKVIIKNIDDAISFDNKSVYILIKDIVPQVNNKNDIISLITTEMLVFQLFKEYFSNIFIYDNEELKYPVYYGTGTEWKF